MRWSTKVLVFTLSILFISLIVQTVWERTSCPQREVVSSNQFPSEPLLNNWGKAHAIPVYARKHKVSCTTCHVAYPKLNQFGQAYKRNGMRWAGWPKIEDFPDTPPLAVVVGSTLSFRPDNDTANNQANFDGLGASATLLSGGELGKHFSFYGGLAVNSQTTNPATGNSTTTTEIEIERIYGVYRPFDESWVMARVGQFEPTIFAISNHRSLLGSYFVTSDRSVGDNQFTLESTQQGVEISGIASNGRLGYYTGVVEGRGNRRNVEKDAYGRVEYKLGGMRLDGKSDIDADEDAGSWGAVTLGAVGYTGFATVADTLTSQEDFFYVIGGDVDIEIANVFANVGYARQENDRPTLATPTTDSSTNHLFAEVNYLLTSWFIPGARYELFDATAQTDHRFTVGSTFLMLPNIKSFVRARFEGPSGAIFDDPNILLGVLAAY